jgi:glycogen synthase
MNQPERILMTADTVGGVWTYALELCLSLHPYGVEVILATMGPEPNPTQRRQAESLENVQLLTSRYQLEWMPDPWSDVNSAGAWLLDLETRFNPDVVHLNGYAHGALPWRAPLLVVGHSCVCSWWESVHREPAPALRDPYRHAIRAGLQQADLVVAPTNAMLQALVRHYGPLPRTQIIPNGRSLETPFAAAKEPIVLSAGRLWDQAKNVAALREIADDLPWPVCVAGATADDGSLASNSNFRYLGALPASEMALWFAHASIYALPARYEPFGLSALEAALCGCALVLGDIASLREVWGDTALFVDPDSPGDLRRALARLIGDPASRAQLARAAYHRASQFTPERMARSYLQAYQTLLVNHRVMPAHRALSCA